MSSAFILLNSEVGQEKEVVTEIAKISTVKEVFRVYGVYDIILKIEEEDMRQLKETVTHKIRIIPGVKSSLTLMIL